MDTRTDDLAGYVQVATRIERFYKDHPTGRILTSIVEHRVEDGFVLMKADIYRAVDEPAPAATGHAFEFRDQGEVNRTSYVENCETSCVGRGLALLGYEVKNGIASREEMEKVERHNGSRSHAAPAIVLPMPSYEWTRSQKGKLTIVLIGDQPEPEQTECPDHPGKLLRRRVNDGGSWLSHQLDEPNKYCSVTIKRQPRPDAIGGELRLKLAAHNNNGGSHAQQV